MRNLIHVLEEKYGKNSIGIFRNWEKMEGKVSNFKNHRRFLLRCFQSGSNPSQLKVKELNENPERRRHYQKSREAIIE